MKHLYHDVELVRYLAQTMYEKSAKSSDKKKYLAGITPDKEIDMPMLYEDLSQPQKFQVNSVVIHVLHAIEETHHTVIKCI